MLNDDQLVEKYNDMIKLIANRLYKRTGAYDVEDLIQIGLMAIIKAYKKFDPSRGLKPSTMLYVSAQRAMIVFMQKNKEQNKIYKKSHPKYLTDTEFLELLPAMDSQDIDIIKYRFDQMTYQEISEKTGLSYSQVKRRLSKIKELKCLKREFYS